MKSNVFIETANVTNYRAAVNTLTDTERGQPGIGVCWGQAGRGKTFAAQNYYAEHGGVYLHVWQDWTQTAMMQALCFEVCGIRPRSANACKMRIVESLEKEPMPIFVDEADRLKIDRIEDLRDIHEMTGISIVLIGEEELLGLLTGPAARRRIWSRVSQEVEFNSCTEEDVTLFLLEAANLDVMPEACSLIRRKSDGDLRLVRNMTQQLEQLAWARETNTVSVGMVEDVLKTRSWRRQ